MRAAGAALFAITGSSLAWAADLYVEIGGSRSPSEYGPRIEQAVREQQNRLALLSQSRLDLIPNRPVFSTPTRVFLTQNGAILPPVERSGTRSGDSAGDITLQFDTVGDRVFPGSYRTQLEATYTAAKSAMDALFGVAAQAGAVRVLNYDADIPARQAVSGGIYIPNAPGGPEIRFPVYLSPTSAGINFIHTLLLAYNGSFQYPFDVYNEGLVRAATIRVARAAGTIPNSSAAEIEQTLDSLYDAAAVYNWSNSPGLGAPNFIAPNLVNEPLPSGGSTGGIYLLRYKMAGTAFAKILTQYPSFAAAFNDYYRRNPANYQTETELNGLAQGILNLLSGTTGATIEGLPFGEWARRQFIFDTDISAGIKIVPEAFPFAATPSTSDFGVFGLVANVFRVDSAGNEVLLSGTSYPIYWRSDFTRFFTSAQDDVIPIAGGYGSVAPNFPADGGSNQIYRVAVDVPYQGQNVRLYVPAGAYSTGANPTPKNVYGTVVGYDQGAVAKEVVINSLAGTAVAPVINSAFGISITNPAFAQDQSVTLTLRQVGSGTILATVVVNKGVGDLVADIRNPSSFVAYPMNLGARLGAISVPLEPYRANASTALGIAANELLFARWNAFTGRYSAYPDEGQLLFGPGFFVRPSAPMNRIIEGRTSADTPLSVSLNPGWTLVGVPTVQAVAVNSLQVTSTTQPVTPFDQSANLVGQTVFGFSPDPVNPDLGTFVPVTTLEPGKAYFMRTLVSQGAVVVFPATINNALTSRAPKRRGNVVPGTWNSQLEFRSLAGHYSLVRLGQSSQASDGLDQLDEPLPPSITGGFQGMVESGLFQDIRQPRLMATYSIRLKGLTPGQRYEIRNRAVVGSTAFSLFGFGASTLLAPGAATTFVASSSEATFTAVNR
jgi:hypothetical protein